MVMIKITLNGKEKEIPNDTTLEKLLSEMKLPKIFVVEKNLEIIYKEDYKTVGFKDGDSVEIASFCGGG